MWFGGLFGARPEIFPPLKQVEVEVPCEALRDVFQCSVMRSLYL